ncbi:hypothetical protein [Nocardioides marmoriginsengisoli]|nr:hypothetical protein [Nocardioides marmoriginsengisoli]
MRNRDDLLRQVHRRLAHRDFAERFSVMTESGERPIVVALLEDSINELCVRVRNAGGAANVVTQHLDGMVVFNMVAGEVTTVRPEPPSVKGDATVGVMLQQLMFDGGRATYRVCTTKNDSQSGVADNPRLLPVG